MGLLKIKPCKSKSAIEVVPPKKVHWDLNDAGSLLQKQGYEIMVDARVLMIFKDASTDVEFTIFPRGKLLLKTRDVDLAENLAVNIYSALGLMEPQ